jgi:polyribonucleotide nucleotidyltransferase
MGKQMEDSDIDIFMVGRKVVPGTGGRPFDINLVMVEGGAREIDEDAAVGAIRFGLESIRPLIEIQEEIRKAAGKPKKVVEAIQIDGNLRQKVVSATEKKMREAYVIPVKQTRHTTLGKIREEILSQMTAEDPKLGPQINYVLEELEKKILREMILQQKRRIDGRSNTDIRPISCEVGILPRTHGSALFTRGETQALVSITLGTSSDEQRMDYAAGEEYRAFMLHYNFPPYCVGEVRPLRGPGRREIGHGALARRALLPLLPTPEEFPYTMRIVSDILSSNGSSSMASVCGGALCLMDAGVPVKGVTAGIAMGLLKEGENVVILSDILGDEDHAGDMDFKVCGTERGITAMQMDIKIDGITEDILGKALHQAREGRLFIIGKIKETIDKPRESLSVYAPRITMIKVKPDRIRDVIGTGGKNIRQIISETGVSIDVEDDGTVMIASNDAEAAERAIAMVRWLTEEAEIGKIYLGTVKKVVDFGAFVEILPGTEGLVHISQLDTKRVNKVTDVVKEGDKVPVKVIEIDRSGKIRLSRKDALGENVPKNHPR